ncbi:MAG: hypothetical protein AB7L91_00550 [Dehalococcoidia bacterium]
MPRLIALLAVWHLLAGFITLGVPGFGLMLAGAWVAHKHPATSRGSPLGRTSPEFR